MTKEEELFSLKNKAIYALFDEFWDKVSDVTEMTPEVMLKIYRSSTLKYLQNSGMTCEELGISFYKLFNTLMTTYNDIKTVSKLFIDEEVLDDQKENKKST